MWGRDTCWQCYVGHVVPRIVRTVAGGESSGIEIKKKLEEIFVCISAIIFEICISNYSFIYFKMFEFSSYKSLLKKRYIRCRPL